METWPRRAVDIVNHLDGLGYGAKPFNMELAPLAANAELSGLLKALGVAGAALAFLMTLSVPVWSGAEMSQQTRTLMHWVSAIIALPAVAYAGRPFFVQLGACLKTNTPIWTCLYHSPYCSPVRSVFTKPCTAIQIPILTLL